MSDRKANPAGRAIASGMRILFITSNRVGDAILSTGLLDHLIRTHPNARITVVCGRVAEGVFARMPNRERTIVLDKRPYGRHWLALWARVARLRWNLVVDIRGSAMAWVVRTSRRAVWRRRTGHKVLELAAVLKLDPAPLPVAWTAPEDRARAVALLPEGPFIALGPTANWKCTGVTTLSRLVITQITVPYAATTNLNFDSLGTQTISLTGNLTLTSSNLGAGKSLLVRLVCDASLRTLVWPAAWKWVGAVAPANIAANKTGLLQLHCFGTSESDVVARWVVEV